MRKPFKELSNDKKQEIHNKLEQLSNIFTPFNLLPKIANKCMDEQSFIQKIHDDFQTINKSYIQRFYYPFYKSKRLCVVPSCNTGMRLSKYPILWTKLKECKKPSKQYCNICKTTSGTLNLHEQWIFKTKSQKCHLKWIEYLCNDCHNMMHINFAIVRAKQFLSIANGEIKSSDPNYIKYVDVIKWLDYYIENKDVIMDKMKLYFSWKNFNHEDFKKINTIYLHKYYEQKEQGLKYQYSKRNILKILAKISPELAREIVNDKNVQKDFGFNSKKFHSIMDDIISYESIDW